ncbi:hypothetical protein AB8E26_14795 [Stenotrophomonas rhizophila]|uniref:hypothetical protein n=1 Tax=Stenotrophomonas rhizophila TaxID=216778 RepID=UPI003512A012
MEKAKEPSFFPLDGFEVAIDGEHNVVTLGLLQVRLKTVPPVFLGSFISAEMAEEIGKALIAGARELKLQRTGSPARH